MRKLTWLLTGAVLGFVAAHFVNRSPEGRRFFARVNRGIDELQSAFVTGYHEAEAEAEPGHDGAAGTGAAGTGAAGADDAAGAGRAL